MQFGVYLNQYRSERSSFGLDDLLEQATTVEALGFDSVAVGERHFYDQGFYDPWTCLTALGARTERLTIASNVLLLPSYHPIRLAEQIAGLDRLTGGRTMFGLAIGYRERELENFGVGMDERGVRFRECISVLKRLLSGERFDHDGEFYQFEDAFVRPGPVQHPRPPLYGGGGGDIAIKRAAYRCDGFTAGSADPESLSAQIDRYRDAVAAAGGDPDEAPVAVMLNGYVADSEAAAKDALEPALFDLLESYRRWNNPQAERPTWEDVEDAALIGTPEAVTERIEAYESLDIDHLFFRTQFPGMDQETTLASVRRFGEHVLPSF